MSSDIEEYSTTLQSLLTVKPPGVSGSRIRKLTQLASALVASESVVVQKLYTHFKKTPGSHKLGALYVVDAIVRGYQDEAKKASETVGPDAPEGTYAAGVYRISGLIEDLMDDILASHPSAEVLDKVRKVVDIWERAATFSPASVASMRTKIAQLKSRDSEAPDVAIQSTTPTGSPPAQSAELTGATASAPSAAPAAVPDTASILQALANIAKQNASAAPAAPAAPAVHAAPPQAPSSMPNLSQVIGSMPTPAAVTGQPWNLSDWTARAGLNNQNQNPMGDGGRDNSGGREFRDGRDPRDGGRDPRGNFERRRSRSPPRGDEYSRGRERRRSRSPRGGRGGRQREGGEVYLGPRPNADEVRNVSTDPSLPPGTIRVFSRTLFVGGIHPGMTQDDLHEIFKPYANVQTIVFNKEKKHAFVKVYERKDAEVARRAFEDMFQQGKLQLRARWGVGFGPRDCSDYATGVSIVPIDRLTDADKRWAVSAEYGGTGGKPLVGGLCIEEPDIEIGAGVSSKAISKRMSPGAIRAADDPYRRREGGDRGDRFGGRGDRGDRFNDRGDRGDRFGDRGRDRRGGPGGYGGDFGGNNGGGGGGGAYPMPAMPTMMTSMPGLPGNEQGGAPAIPAGLQSFLASMQQQPQQQQQQPPQQPPNGPGGYNYGQPNQGGSQQYGYQSQYPSYMNQNPPR